MHFHYLSMKAASRRWKPVDSSRRWLKRCDTVMPWMWCIGTDGDVTGRERVGTNSFKGKPCLALEKCGDSHFRWKRRLYKKKRKKHQKFHRKRCQTGDFRNVCLANWNAEGLQAPQHLVGKSLKTWTARCGEIGGLWPQQGLPKPIQYQHLQQHQPWEDISGCSSGTSTPFLGTKYYRCRSRKCFSSLNPDDIARTQRHIASEIM